MEDDSDGGGGVNDMQESSSTNVASKSNLKFFDFGSDKPSYSDAAGKSRNPSNDQGFTIEWREGLILENYLEAIDALVGAANIIAAYKSFNKVYIYLSDKKSTEAFVDKHKVLLINNQSLIVASLAIHYKRLLFTNVPPAIPNKILDKLIDDLKVRKRAGVENVRNSTNQRKFQHIINNKRIVYLHPDDVSLIPEVFKYRYNGQMGIIFASAEPMRCFLCHEEGHTIKKCLLNNAETTSQLSPINKGTKRNHSLVSQSSTSNAEKTKIHVIDPALISLPPSSSETSTVISNSVLLDNSTESNSSQIDESHTENLLDDLDLSMDVEKTTQEDNPTDTKTLLQESQIENPTDVQEKSNQQEVTPQQSQACTKTTLRNRSKMHEENSIDKAFDKALALVSPVLKTSFPIVMKKMKPFVKEANTVHRNEISKILGKYTTNLNLVLRILDDLHEKIDDPIFKRSLSRIINVLKNKEAQSSSSEDEGGKS